MRRASPSSAPRAASSVNEDSPKPRCATSRMRPTSPWPTSTTTSRGKDEILFFLPGPLAGPDARRSRRSATPARIGRATRLRHVLRAHCEAVLDEVEGAVAHLATDALSDPLRQPHRRQARSLRTGRSRSRRRCVTTCECGQRRRRGPDARDVRRAQLDRTWFRPDGERTAAAVADTIASYLIRGLDETPSAARTTRAR